MNNPLHEHLKLLKSVRPEADFLARGRINLMNVIAPKPKRTSITSFIPIFKMSFATAALSLLIFASAQKTPANTTTGEVVASLDANAIQAERIAVNATGSVANAAYFKDISPAISLALTDIADPAINWGSETKVKQAIAVLTKNQ